MKILLYSTDFRQAEQFEKNITSTFENSDIVQCVTIKQVDSTLRAMFSFSAIILMVSCKEELLELLTIQRVLDKSRIIIILPDNSGDLIQFALKLYPRYLTDAGESTIAITEVLKKIYSTSNSPTDFSCH